MIEKLGEQKFRIRQQTCSTVFTVFSEKR